MSVLSPPPNLSKVTIAQRSEYWSGRFMGLYDRFATDWIARETSLVRDASNTLDVYGYGALMPPQPMATGSQQLGLRGSATMSSLPTLRRAPKRGESDEVADRCRRVFQQLAAECATSEARQSLRDWQQQYARIHDRPCLLPEGGTMKDPGTVARFFGSGGSSRGSRRGERTSLSSLRDLATSRLARKSSAPRLSTPQRKKTLAK